MASIRLRKGKWQAQVRLSQGPQISRTFNMKADALAWARATESDIQAGRHKVATSCTATLLELLERYAEQVTPTKRSAPKEKYRIGKLMQQPFVRLKATDVTPAVLNRFKEARLQEVGAQAARHDFNLLGHVFNVARLEWGYATLDNPVLLIRKPAQPAARTRRLQGHEMARFLEAVAKCPNPFFRAFVRLAIETGMRRGELLGLAWADVDLERGEAYLGMTKNGSARMVPLTPTARAIFGELKASGSVERPLCLHVSTVKKHWSKALEDSGVQDFHVHDMRREAVSRLFEYGLSIPEVAAVSGHKDWRMVQRYVKFSTTQLVKKLSHLQIP